VRSLLLSLAVAATMLPATATNASAAGDGPVVLAPPLPERREPNWAEESAAQRAYAETQRLFEAGDLEGALKAAEETFALVPNASTALVATTILLELGRGCDAFAVLLVAADLDPTGEEREAVNAELGVQGIRCKPQRGWARIEVEPADARIRVAGVTVPARRTIGALSGKHEVEVSAPGHEPQKSVLRIRAGRAAAASFKLKALPKPAPVPEPVVTGPTAGGADPAAGVEMEAEGPSKALVWGLIGGGGAMLLGGVTFHVMAADAASDGDNYRSAVAGESAREQADRVGKYNDAKSAASTRSIVAYGLYGVGAAAAGVGTWLLLQGTGAGDTAHVVPLWWEHGAGVIIGTRF
jgi:hypothetical protein